MGARAPRRPGRSSSSRAGILHTFWNESAAPAKQVTFFTPSGIEEYFEELSQVLAVGGDDSLEAAKALMEKHDMIVPLSTGQAYGALTLPQTPPG
jgi:hypothetical protein